MAEELDVDPYPGLGFASMFKVVNPLRLNSKAHALPRMPEPTIATSHTRVLISRLEVHPLLA
eukprot:2684190-Amphidinium_carterae.1